ncbi:hypothetical protein ACFV2N_47710 [Streptomyces sp. NPDC059680]|uniref:hypothetical protein n=1 Tax=Streptomyces sp. NPDC059680 TaxID=3346904 RepID=UPI0036BAC62D
MSAFSADAGKGYLRTDADRAAAIALLNAITQAVEDTKTGRGDLQTKIQNLKYLAEAYALVTHGNQVN